MVLKKILDAIERKGVKQGKAEQAAGIVVVVAIEAARLVAWFAGW